MQKKCFQYKSMSDACIVFKCLHHCRNQNRGSLHLNHNYARDRCQTLPLSTMLMRAKYVNRITIVTSHVLEKY